MPVHELEPDTLDLRDYLAVVRRQKVLIAATVGIVVVAAMAVTLLQTPVYESTVELVVEPLGSAEQSALEQALFGKTELETQRKLVSSTPVAGRVVEQLGLDATPEELLEHLRVNLLTETQILEITASHTDPETAAGIAQAFADAYLEDRRENGLQRVLAATAALEERAEGLRERIDELGDRIAAAEASPTREARGDARSEPTAAATDASDVEVLRRERDSLLTQLGQVTAQATTFEATDEFVRGGGRVIVPAAVPQSPSSPKPVRTGILAVVLGLMLGTGAAFLRDHLDDAIRSEEDAVRASGRPVLGRIPHVPEAEQRGRLISLLDPWSAAAEAYRTLRTNVRFVLGGASSGADRAAVGRSLAVTSPAAQEGKTTTAANLAVAAARAGARVLLVDADLRRPNVHKTLGVDGVPGLSDLLVGEVELRDVIVDVGVPNLRLIPAGNIPPNPAELLASPAMVALRHQLTELAELVIYDTPPVLAIADALELTPGMTQTLLVVNARRSHQRAVRAAVERLESIGTPVAGTVLNDIDTTQPGYYYGYGYGYGDYRPAQDEFTTARPPARPRPGGASEPASPPSAPHPRPAPPAQDDPAFPLDPDRDETSPARPGPAVTPPQPDGERREAGGRPAAVPDAQPDAEHAVTAVVGRGDDEAQTSATARRLDWASRLPGPPDPGRSSAVADAADAHHGVDRPAGPGAAGVKPPAGNGQPPGPAWHANDANGPVSPPARHGREPRRREPTSDRATDTSTLFDRPGGDESHLGHPPGANTD
ncbi:MAG: polysaccharide biosynthesis tyrosine autokinase [Actinobacteria bacterium]|nr:polysaccharide biosynthesis tyrosine autokinase [Actinomycetota bacterium]